MVKLNEDMIVARTRVSDMNQVKKLNCWGAELSDIAVIRKLRIMTGPQRFGHTPPNPSKERAAIRGSISNERLR